jgi:hypothetical protein
LKGGDLFLPDLGGQFGGADGASEKPVAARTLPFVLSVT